MSNITDNFVEKIYNIRSSKISPEIISQAKGVFLDYLGVTYAGSQLIREKGENYISQFREQGECTIIGFGRKSSLHNAALINGFSSHVAELDDGHRLGMIHTGSPVLSALFPVAEYYNLNGLDFLLGIIAGYEAAVRLSMAIQPSHKKKGYHASGTCGTIGAAIGVAIAMNGSKVELKSALSAAVTSMAGVLEIQENGSELKPYNTGRAAFNGLSSALIGRSGFIGPDNILGGRRGLAVFTGNLNLSDITNDWDYYAIEKIYQKLYASCRHSHPAIEAALSIKSLNEIGLTNINRIIIHTYELAIHGHDHTHIEGENSAKMSIPYSVAVALYKNKAGIHEFMPEYIRDEKILSLAKKIEVYISDELTQLCPQKRAAIVEFEMNDGNVYSKRVDYPKGEPENPLSKTDIENKFYELATFAGKTKKKSEDIVRSVWDIENSIGEIYQLL
jgi:Uncharacterized protein involved in propionate catabolism